MRLRLMDWVSTAASGFLSARSRPCLGLCSVILYALIPPAADQQIIFKAGSSFGMCAGYCFKEVRIEGTQAVWKLQATRSIKLPAQTISGTLAQKELRGLLESLDRKALTSLPNVIGCPDCADGGAAWIDVTFADGVTKKVKFEYSKPPQSIKSLAEKLRAILEKVPTPALNTR